MFEIFPQVVEIFKPLHVVNSDGIFPINIFAIPWSPSHDMDQKTIGLLVCRNKNNVYVQYCLEGYNHPIAITAYEGIRILPDNFNDALPSIEELEAEIVRN